MTVKSYINPSFVWKFLRKSLCKLLLLRFEALLICCICIIIPPLMMLSPGSVHLLVQFNLFFSIKVFLLNTRFVKCEIWIKCIVIVRLSFILIFNLVTWFRLIKILSYPFILRRCRKLFFLEYLRMFASRCTI